MSVDPSDKSELRPELAKAVHQFHLGVKLSIFLLAELLLVNLMIYTAAYRSAAPPASSGNFYMWGVGCIIFEIFLIAFILIGLDGPLKQRLIFSSVLLAAFTLTTLVGLSGIDQAFPFERVITSVMLIPMCFVVSGTPILAMRFLTHQCVRSRKERNNNSHPASIRTILLATAGFSVALVAAQQSLTRVSAMPVGGLKIEAIQFVVGFWVTMAIASTCGAFMLLGLKDKINLHKHGLFVGIGTNLLVWLILLATNFLVTFKFEILTVTAYFTISLVAALAHSYLLIYVLELLGFKMVKLR